MDIMPDNMELANILMRTLYSTTFRLTLRLSLTFWIGKVNGPGCLLSPAGSLFRVSGPARSRGGPAVIMMMIMTIVLSSSSSAAAAAAEAAAAAAAPGQKPRRRRRRPGSGSQWLVRRCDRTFSTRSYNSRIQQFFNLVSVSPIQFK